MLSNSTESTNSNKMVTAIKELLRTLNDLAVITSGPSGFFHAESLYEAVYEYGRHTHLYPNFRQLFTIEDKTALKEHFPKAFVTLVNYTPALVNHIDSSMLNLARTKRSQLWFLKNEVLDLYKEINENDLPKEVTDVLKKLEESNNVLQFNISNWTRRGYRDADDDPNDVPNLNGVPENHNWWTKEHREMWKNKE